MGKSREERLALIIKILSISPPFREKDIKTRVAVLPQFQSVKLTYFSSRQIKQMQRKATQTERLADIFSGFDFVLQQPVLDAIAKFKTGDPVLLHFLALVTLYSYVSFILKSEEEGKVHGICRIFNAFAVFSGLSFQDVIGAAQEDVLLIIYDDLSDQQFKTLFPTFSDYFLFNPSATNEHFLMLPFFLQSLIRFDKYEADSSAGRLSSLISMLLQDRKDKFSPKTIEALFQVIHPFLLQLHDLALVVFTHMREFLMRDSLIVFFKDLPWLFMPYIEERERIFLLGEPHEYVTFEPYGSPENSFRFHGIDAFPNGFDVTKGCPFPVPDLADLCLPSLVGILDLLMKTMLADVAFCDIMLETSNDLLKSKVQSPFYLDYLALFVRIWVEISRKQPIKSLQVPEMLFDPRYPILELEDNKRLFSMRYFAVGCLLVVEDCNFEQILLSLVKYPLLFSETVELCVIQLDRFVEFLRKNQRTVRAIRQMALQLQYHQFKTRENNPAVEAARISLFRMMFHLFQTETYLDMFFKDPLFLSFFMSLLYEKNVRPFALRQIRKYMATGIQNDFFCTCAIQVVEQIPGNLPEIRAYSLETDLFETINSSESFVKPMLPLADAIQRQFEYFDASEGARKLLMQIMVFFTLSSKIKPLSPSNLIQLETALARFDGLGLEEYDALVSLLAGELLQERIPDFEIKNGHVLHMLFRFFGESTEVDIIGFINKLCIFSPANCIACNQSRFDQELLDYVLKHQDENTPKISEILILVSTIACVISSPAVVQKFISLFIPVESRYITCINQKLLQPLQLIFTRERERPSVSVPIDRPIDEAIPSTGYNIKNGFTFVSWIYFEEAQIASILAVTDESGPQVTLEIQNDVFYLNGRSTMGQVPRKRWSFITVTYQDNALRLYCDSQSICILPVNIQVWSGQVLVRVAGARKAQGKVGNFGMFQPLTDAQIRNLFMRGPRTIRSEGKPVFYYTAERIRALANLTLKNEIRTFTDILLRFFKVEVLIPLFAQLELPMMNGTPSDMDVLDVIAVFRAALDIGEHEQQQFCEANGFSIISHLLYAASPRQVNFEVYEAFFSMFESLLHEPLQQQLFTQILVNFDLWIQCSPEDHQKILEQWEELLFPRYSHLFLEFCPFKVLLNRMRIYYWYNPMQGSNIRGDENSQRPRDPDLDITTSRKILFEILFKMSALQFATEDFSALMNHCITLTDSEQTLDLLEFMYRLVTAEHRPIQSLNKSECFEIFSRIHLVLNNIMEDIHVSVVRIIVAMHKYGEIPDLLLTQHLYLLFVFVMKKTPKALFDGCYRIMKEDNVPELFPYCASMADHLKDRTMYHELEPSEAYVTCKYWALNSILTAAESTPADCECILSFLARCSVRQWRNLFDQIRLVEIVTGPSQDNILPRYLNILCLSALNLQGGLPADVIDELFQMIKFQLFFRERESGYMSPALLAQFRSSPFASGHSGLTPKRSASMRIKKTGSTLEQLRMKDFEKLNYVFGLRLDANKNWRDGHLAAYALKLVTRCKTKQSIAFGIVTAAFLILVQYEDVCEWLEKMQLRESELLGQSSMAWFLLSKALLFDNPPLKVEDEYEVWTHTRQVLSELPQLFEDSVANGYLEFVKQFRKVDEDAHQMTKKIFTLSAQDSADESIYSLARMMENIRQSTDFNSKSWQRLWRNFVVDNAPWDPSRVSANKVVTRWKRDTSLCGYAFPCKMRRNHNFDQHVNAAFSRDTGNLSSVEQRLKEYQEKLMEEYKNNAPPEILEVQSLPLEKTSSRTVFTDDSQPKSKAKQFAFEGACELIKVQHTISGTFKVSSDSVRIVLPSKMYVLFFIDMKSVLLRRRFCDRTAIEIFMIDGRSYFVNFPHRKALDVIRSMNLPDSVNVQKTDFSAFITSTGVTQNWVDGTIGNFEYLLKLNLLSGRSFNDCSQYPFFPWVVADYESESLDLSSPASYRDLEKPIGAVGPERLSELLQRMHDMKNFHSKPYLYSSFAICPLAIYLWLLRVEPFTTLHIEMQGGKFDHPSRLFSSVGDTYRVVTTRLNDYRELPPEFYYFPEFAYNDNNFDLGVAHGKPINDVILPPWAHESGHEFCYLLRKAFESEYVSEHLNDWIDLFFGYKQTGDAASEANNVYSPDMYEAAWTKEIRKDPRRKAEVEAVMSHVGQLPVKIFTDPHPRRNIRPLESILEQPLIKDLSLPAITAAHVKTSDKIEIICYSDHVLSSFSVTMEPEITLTPKVTWSKTNTITAMTSTKQYEILALLGTGKLMMCDATTMDLVYRELANVSLVTSSEDYVAVVSDEATLNLFGPRFRYDIPFFGDTISCCTISRQFGIAACGTISGSVVTCSLFDGTKVNAISLGDGFKPTKVLVTDAWGFIVTYAYKVVDGKSVNRIFLHNINGRFIRSVPITFDITSWCTWASRRGFDYVMIANEQGKLSVFEAFYVDIGESFHRCYENVVALAYLPDMQVAVAVSQDGRTAFVPLVIE